MSFPATPTVGQQAAVGGRQFVWQGSAWDLVATVTGHAAQHATGGSDAITAASIGAMSVTGDSTMTGVLTVQPAVGPVKPDGSLRVIGDNTDANIAIQRHADINANPGLRFKRTRGTKAAQTVAQSGDGLGTVAWYGVSAEGTEVVGGSIPLLCTAAPVAGDTALRTQLNINIGAGTLLAPVASFTPTTSTFYNTLMVGVGANVPALSSGVGIHCAGSTFRLGTARTPASSTATGNTGEICWDTSYVYLCVTPNTWRRIAHSTW